MKTTPSYANSTDSTGALSLKREATASTASPSQKPGHSSSGSLLTPLEIESLRNEMRESAQRGKELLKQEQAEPSRSTLPP